MLTSTLRMRTLAAKIAAGTLAVVGLTGLVSAPAQAAPIGDGVWAPSHEESTRLIPLCKGPDAVLKFLDVNFSDHGRDSAAYVKRNAALLTSLAGANSNPLTTLPRLVEAVAQIPAYALNDAAFHLPASTLALATGCGAIKSTGINPFALVGS